MAVQFKFRSSVNFDSIDIDARTSISVRDLKSKIIRRKNLNICQDSDLVFSDAITGQEYTDENVQLLSGSYVIIKRVPAESVKLDMPHFSSYHNLHNKDSSNAKSLVAANAETVDFDDFGVDLYPIPKKTEFSSDLEVDKDTCIHDYEQNADITRNLGPAVAGCQKPEASDLSDAIPGGHANSAVEHTVPRTKSKPEEADMIMEKVGSVNPLDTWHADLSSELKCSLCNSFFEEAMMIPCCQHSFCKKCICQVLQEKATCPKCFLTKRRVEDLLPNLSLRQAIEHFIESQNLIIGPKNDCCQYAPDGESGIHPKDVSCGPELPHSETGTGSNHFLAESAYNSPVKKDAHINLGANHFRKRHGSTRIVPDGLASFEDFQGESKPVNEQAEPTITNKRPPWVHAAGHKSLLGTGKHRKGDRTCYMCGSPDHFVRDCSVASSPHPMLHAGNPIFPGAMPGYASPYWNGAPVPHAQPFRNPYGNQPLTACGTSLLPPAPFAVPAYMPYSFPAYGGYMRMRGVTPLLGTGENYYLSRSEFLDGQGREKRRKCSNENLRREQYHDVDEESDLNERHCCNWTERLHVHKSHIHREMSISYSEDSSTKGPQSRHRHHNNTYEDMLAVDGQQKTSCLVVGGRDQKVYHRRERSNSEVDDMASSFSCPNEEKHYHRSSRKHKETREHYGSVSSRGHHHKMSKKDDDRKRTESDFKRHNQKHHSLSGSGIERNDSSDKKLQKESSHGSRHSKHVAKRNVDKLGHDRWHTVSGSDEDSAEGYQHRRRKRKHSK